MSGTRSGFSQRKTLLNRSRVVMGKRIISRAFAVRQSGFGPALKGAGACNRMRGTRTKEPGMKHRSKCNPLFVLLAIALVSLPGCARKSLAPAVVIAKDASWHERAAAAEIRRYLYLRTGELPALKEADRKSTRLNSSHGY